MLNSCAAVRKMKTIQTKMASKMAARYNSRDVLKEILNTSSNFRLNFAECAGFYVDILSYSSWSQPRSLFNFTSVLPGTLLSGLRVMFEAGIRLRLLITVVRTRVKFS